MSLVVAPVAADLPLEPESARRAREELEPLRTALDEITFSDLRLLISELVVEALNHKPEAQAGKVELRAELRDGRVHAEVAEGDLAFRVPSRRPEPGAVGWGIYLVARLSSRWGLRRGSERSAVWLEVESPHPS